MDLPASYSEGPRLEPSYERGLSWLTIETYIKKTLVMTYHTLPDSSFKFILSFDVMYVGDNPKFCWIKYNTNHISKPVQHDKLR
jgi:hypothetical protein